MSGRLAGKVAFITGAGRGQGRSHAVRLAQEGADIIAVDICEDIDGVPYPGPTEADLAQTVKEVEAHDRRDIASNPYPMSTSEDLAETERQVKELGQRIVARQADVRERSELERALADGLTDLGHLDIVVANAGICPMPLNRKPELMDFFDAVDVDLVGVMNTVAVSIPHLGAGASVVITGSTAGLMEGTTDTGEGGAGGTGYGWAKKQLVDYTEKLALLAAPQSIRVNCVHPTNCNTHLLQNELMYKLFRPDLDNPTREDAEPAFVYFQAMPIPYIEPVDVSNLVLFLASDEARYITGQQIRVDAGSLLKFPNGPQG